VIEQKITKLIDHSHEFFDVKKKNTRSVIFPVEVAGKANTS